MKYLCVVFALLLTNVLLLVLRRRFMNVPVLVNNLGLLEQLAYWKASAPCSAAGYNLTMKKHGYDPAHGRDGRLRHIRVPARVTSDVFSPVVPAPSSSPPTGC